MGAPRVAVVWCPDWPVVAAGLATEVPAVVVAGGRVVAGNAAARAAGVRRGQRLRDAERACPGLVHRPDDATGQVRCFERVLAVVEQVVPRVEVVRPGLAALPARGPARYFGGEPAFGDRLRATLAGQGIDARIGIADSLLAAMLAARVGGGVVIPPDRTPAFLAGQPVGVLDRPELTSLLVRLGIRTLGELAALPAGDVLARFGPDGALCHRLARGLPARPLSTRPPGADLAAVREFDPPARQDEPLVFAAKALAEQLHATLARHGLLATRVEVEVRTAGGRSRSRLWRHDGLLSSLAVAERVRWQLAAWRTDAVGSGAAGSDVRPGDVGPRGAAGPDAGDGADGVVLLRLAPDQVAPDPGRQLVLWGREREREKVDRAATRVQALLGHLAVTRPAPAGGRGPGERVLLVPWGDEHSPRFAAAGPWPGRVPDPAPGVVPAAPIPAEVVGADGVPVRVSGRCAVSAAPVRLRVAGERERRVTGWAGPWPVVEHWWDAATAHRRARVQVTTDDGAAYLLLLEAGRWWVEGGYG